ncbi:hypothetical protein M409DRAFT_57637 [Zasmidium cellare ATCC 36951]|uniref:Uncharacterized protein n=1 Tax=Zasmidium cellare ATCC 36951 TaxID=1080233 RepID=A0A6A6C842_ZASCE|nr:uncharacterized protein M409DRAFT_57637 [Zasmidium cellare ATCC 36951]KAF2163357.1 hypothetical protein M409DRAFT_57637 [Zasmidium cellare ATCC 36951]
MPSMFSRRRGSSASRASSQIPLDRNTTSNAAAAASQAFLKNKPSTGSLSSAAAAAALRSMTTTPEPVGAVQTKRMVRRGSTSSNASSAIVSNGRGGVPVRGGLQRRDSGGSMTERSFRSPSPGRSNGALSPALDAAPPVPAIPSSISRQHQRSSSLDPPQRVISPTPAGRGNGRAASMDRYSMPPPASASSRTGKRLSNVNEELERTDSNRNVNFSRPMNSQPSSPVSPTVDKQYTHGTGNWFSESVPVPSQPKQTVQEEALEQKIARIQAAAGQPVNRDNGVNSAQGNYLQRPSERAGIAPASYEAADAIMVYDPSTRTFIAKPRTQPAQPASPEPPSPTTWQPAAPVPGTYDPHTRTIVPLPEPKPAVQVQRPERPALETDLQPPPRNPARLSPTIAARSFLHKQPSVVREEPEDEDGSVADSELMDTCATIQTSAGPAKSYVAPAGSKQRSSSLDIPRGALDSASRGRGGSNVSTSPSPNRIHFSASPVMNPIRHDPPPRDLSPAKPALKNAHSPASSIRTSSPLANFSPAPKSPISETSDNTSQASQDAFTGRKKKSVRVSFDEQPQEIEPPTVAATPNSIMRDRPVVDDLDDDELMKPRPALPSFGSVRKQRVTHDVPEKVTEMAPESQDASNDHAIGGILKNANEAKASSDPVAPEVTSKETAGYVSDDSDDLGEPVATSTPAPPSTVPEVKLESSPEEKQETKVRDFAAQATTASDQNEDADVPAINLLPPTPGAEEERKTLSAEGDQSPKPKASFEINVPGGWAGEEENEAETTSAGAAAATVATIESQDEPAAVPEDPVIYSSPRPASPALNAINEDNSDDSAEFSDAAEDLSEFDNGGFASLDAIAVSPVLTSSPAPKPKDGPAPLPESPSIRQASKRMDKVNVEGQGSGDWSEATAYWSRLSQQQREQIEREHFSSDDEALPAPARKPKKKTSAQAAPVKVPAPAAAAQVQQKPAAQPAKPALKKTMRAQPEPVPVEGEVHMRKSMRNGGAGGMSGSLRDSTTSQPQQTPVQPKSALQKGTMRPGSSGQLSLSAMPGSGPQDSAFPKMKASQTQPPTQPKPKPQPAPVMSAKLQKELSHDSDSESSFRKKRRSKVDGRYTMKRSMRGGPVEAEPAPSIRNQRPTSPEPPRGKGKDSFSIRSLSPTGSLFGRKKRGEEVRQSIRGSSVDAGPRMTMRNGPPQRAAARPAAGQQSTGSRFKSRFVDSDDEGEDERPRRNFFKSRFTDSDDEDDDVFIPADLTPVRGIPRKQGQTDGDSTDLEDEDDDEDEDPRKATRRRQKMSTPLVPDSGDIDKAMEAARKKLGIPEPSAKETSQGEALRNGSLRQDTAPQYPVTGPSYEEAEATPEKKKRSFMGSILRRNRNSTASVPQIGTTASEMNLSSSPALNGPYDADAPQGPSGRPQSPIASPNGKLLRRTSGQQVPQAPRMRRGDSTYSNATAPPAVGEAFSASDRDNWPLPPAVPKIPDHLAGNNRPTTSDGAGNSVVRFDIGTDDGMDGEGQQRGAIYSRRTGKKKKFGLLRRAFGLND